MGVFTTLPTQNHHRVAGVDLASKRVKPRGVDPAEDGVVDPNDDNSL
jgi:hypothetical protein